MSFSSVAHNTTRVFFSAFFNLFHENRLQFRPWVFFNDKWKVQWTKTKTQTNTNKIFEIWGFLTHNGLFWCLLDTLVVSRDACFKYDPKLLEETWSSSYLFIFAETRLSLFLELKLQFKKIASEQFNLKTAFLWCFWCF